MVPGLYVNGVQTRKNFAESVFGGQFRSWIDRHHGFQKLPKKGLAYCPVLKIPKKQNSLFMPFLAH